MAEDIYGTVKTLNGVFEGTTTTFTVGGTALARTGALAQSISLRYDRQISRVLELGSATQYYVVGQSQGQGQFDAILGPAPILGDLIDQLANACNVANNSVELKSSNSSCDTGATGQLVINCSNVVLTSVNVSTTVQDFMVRQGGAFMFVGMQVADEGS